MRSFPREFSQLLTTRGQRLMDRADAGLKRIQANPGWRFLALQGVMDSAKAEAVRRLLERALKPSLQRMERPIPPESVWGLTRNYEELLPKTVRVSTAELDEPKSSAVRIAEEIGLNAMLRSESFHRFAQQLAGRPLLPHWGLQALRYGPGDYSGPHTDHHPEDAEAEDGYFDLHLSFASSDVRDHLLVYERQAHLHGVQHVATQGGVTAYRLPFWHYTTPLEAKPRARNAHRWVLLGTFLYPRLRAEGRRART